MRLLAPLALTYCLAAAEAQPVNLDPSSGNSLNGYKVLGIHN